MEQFLASIGFFAIICIVFILILTYIKSRSEKERKNRDLEKYLNLRDYSWDKDKTHDENISKILSDPEVRRRAEEERVKEVERQLMIDNLERKSLILDRTFSYEYENLLYEIFAPFATKKKYKSLNGEEWICLEWLETEYVTSEIIRLCNVSEEKAEQLLQEFENHRLISFIKITKKKCNLGYLLESKWDVISNIDMNLTKWINQHPERETRDSAEMRRKQYDIVVRTPLSQFIEKYGDFKVDGSGSLYNLYFNRSGLIVFVPSDFYYKESNNSLYGHNRYEIISQINSILKEPDKFVVKDDDGSFQLERV